MLLFTLICSAAFSLQGDSLKIEYPLDDPRNPDCKCHTYQKLAEREYKKALKHESAKAAAVKTNVLQKDINYNAGCESPGRQSVLRRNMKQGTKQVRPQKNKMRKKRKRAKTGHTDACHKW